jgi:plastocyanin
MKTWIALLCACLALGLVAAGCGDDDEDSGDSGGSAATTQEQTAEATEQETEGGGARNLPVVMKDTTFRPGDLPVPKGSTVTWTNEDPYGHDVTKKSGPGPDFSSGEPGAMESGDTFKHTFDTAGTIEYVCTVHPGMEGTVVVK